MSPVIVAATPTRRSGRFAVAADGSSVTDEDSLKKAMRRKAVHNLDSSGIPVASKDLSFLSCSAQRISSQLNSVGVRLGVNNNDISVSTNVLRHMEFYRLTVIPKASTVSDTTYLDEEEANATADGQLLPHLVGVVSEVGLDEDMLSSLCELKASGQKSRSSSKIKSQKPRRQANVLKNPIISQ
jgi:hypothetical protein